MSWQEFEEPKCSERHVCTRKNTRPVYSDKGEQLAQRGHCFIGSRGYAIEKKVEPPFPLAIRSHRLFFACSCDQIQLGGHSARLPAQTRARYLRGKLGK